MRQYMIGNLTHGKFEYPIQYITNGTTIDSYYMYSFNLGACDNISNILALYDQFRINKVVMKFTPVMATVVNKSYDDTTTPGTANRAPTLASCIDLDSESTGNVTQADMKLYPSYRECLGTKKHTRVFTPAMLITGYRSATSSCYLPKYKQWIDCAQNNTPHFGLRVYYEAASPAGAWTYEIRIKLYCSFKSRRTG